MPTGEDPRGLPRTEESGMARAHPEPTIPAVTTDNSRSSGGAGTGLADGHPRPATRVDDAETQAAPVGTRTTAPGLRALVARLPVRGARRATVVTVLAAVVGAVVLGGAAFGYSAAKRATYTSESLV